MSVCMMPDSEVAGPRGGYFLCDGWYICAAVLTPFFTLAGSSTIFLGYFSHPPTAKLSFGVQKLPIFTKIDLFGPKFNFFLDLFGSNFQRPAAHPHQFSGWVPHPGAGHILPEGMVGFPLWPYMMHSYFCLIAMATIQIPYCDQLKTICNYYSSHWIPNYWGTTIFKLDFDQKQMDSLSKLETQLFIHFKVHTFATHLFMHFSQNLFTPKHHSPKQQLIPSWTYTLLRAHRHAECWGAFHPASLSDGHFCFPRSWEQCVEQ